VNRRDFVSIIVSAAAAQHASSLIAQTAKRPLVAVLVGASAATSRRYVSGFAQGMRQLGYADDRSVDVVYRYAGGDSARMPALAEELVQLKPDVVVSGTTAGVLAVKQITSAIPIVCIALTDPVGLGLIESDARPGGQVTGILITVDTLPGKQLELALEVSPGIGRIGMLIGGNNPISVVTRRNAETAAAAFGVKLVAVEVGAPDDLDGAFRKLVDEQVGIVLVLQEAMFLSERRRIAALAAAARLPSIYSFREHVIDGGLMSYGTDLRESFHRAATYVDKVLKGTKPGDLPVELPTRLELAINLKTASTLGLTVPPLVVARADEVIE
jgi:putative ABC transport system substrate-binding protein